MSGKQHVDIYRKLLLRRQLLKRALPGAAYVPFCGDGDIAVEVYSDRLVYAADIDAKRVATCASRLEDAHVVAADCNGWPFPGCDEEFAVADFDAYVYPYDSFRSFWSGSKKAKTMVLFFTDGERQAVKRTGRFRTPDGVKHNLSAANDKRKFYNFWLQRYCKPWIAQAVAPYKVKTVRGYQRRDMLYWGVVVAG